jgi:hypothetical protein
MHVFVFSVPSVALEKEIEAMTHAPRLAAGLAVAILLVLAPAHALADGWIDLSGKADMAAWRQPTEQWQIVGGVQVDPKNPKRLSSSPGRGILVNGPKGKTRNLQSRQLFGDIEVQLEFMIPRGSNSGVKFEGLYELQIFDSWGVKTPTGSDCGGIYPRAELLPFYHHTDNGVPPRSNACKPAGTWQKLEAIFQAPRFDAAGKKTANARFVRVVLNGTLIHENVQVKAPTGHYYREKEVAAGPILLQADHGPVAFRNIRARPLP